MANILLIIADILSIATITICFVFKVPQILRVVKAGHATGLSLKGLLLELSSYTITMMYNYTNGHALLSYMEYPIIVLQEYIIIALVLHYSQAKPTTFIAIFSLYSSVQFAFASNMIDKSVLTVLLPLTTPASALSKIAQLMEILKRKDASSVSVLTWFFSFFTNATRIYTVLMDSADFNLLLNFSISSILSASVMFAAFYYQKLASKVEKTD